LRERLGIPVKQYAEGYEDNGREKYVKLKYMKTKELLALVARKPRGNCEAVISKFVVKLQVPSVVRP
jgi:hypothetical protein